MEKSNKGWGLTLSIFVLLLSFFAINTSLFAEEEQAPKAAPVAPKAPVAPVAPAKPRTIVDYDPIPLHQIPAIECKKCHAEIFEQWEGSMHAQSTALKDPIHGAFYRKVMGDPTVEGVKSKKDKYPVCLQCHAPNAAQDKKTKLDSDQAYSDGVSCVVCHRLKKFKGTKGENGKLRLGLKAYEVSDVLQGPSGFLAESIDKKDAAPEKEGEEKKENPHTSLANMTLGNYQKPSVSADDSGTDDEESLVLPLESNPGLLKTSAACLGCHDKRSNSKGVPLCATGDEYIESKAHVECQSCHMPISNGFANHSMGGGHDISVLKRAIVFDLNAKKDGNSIKTKITLKNSQPHSMPTGAPFRNMVLKLSAYNEQGEKVWQNYEKHPAKEDPQAYFVYEVADDKGHPTTPPKATQLGKNTRLSPYEKRDLDYEIPAKDVVLVRAELYYNLLWAGLVKKLDKQLPDHLKAPQLISWSEKRM